MEDTKKKLKQKICILLATATVFLCAPKGVQSETISNKY